MSYRIDWLLKGAALLQAYKGNPMAEAEVAQAVAEQKSAPRRVLD